MKRTLKVDHLFIQSTCIIKIIFFMKSIHVHILLIVFLLKFSTCHNNFPMFYV